MKRVLIANRGEIAVRIARAAQALGIETVSVHSAADARGLHAKVTTETRAIGGPGGDAVAPYLDIEALIAAATASGCDSVHPGYGFLSENAAFARRCLAEGLTFVGPPPEALELFGDKVKARGLAASLGVPTVAGSAGALASPAEAEAAAGAIGYPVMLKAAAGGGGRGMRRVAGPGELAEAFARCRSEAAAAFGDGSVFLEKLVVRPRHIEVQVLADARGGMIHLWERDCSVQLRNQKVVEIAPAAGLEPGLRQRILDDALKLAKAGGYVNAGTVEFLVEPESGAHFFIECNPRIQVEHTVTEEVTGVDLVETQFRIAAGATLGDLGLAETPPARGYAVQARVTAVGTGALDGYKEPAGPGVRVDSCGYPGLTPPPQFDPMFAKVIARSSSAGTLASAVQRCGRALAEFHIAGLPTNLGQLQAILAEPSVAAGDARTTLLSEKPALASPNTMLKASNAAGLMARPAGAGTRRAEPAAASPALPVGEGEEAVEAPMGGSVVAVMIAPDAAVSAGDPLLVISAMKMETTVTAPCTGVVARMAAVEAGSAVAAGQVLAAIRPSADAGGGATPRTYGEDSWAPVMGQVAALQQIAHDRFGPETRDPGVIRQRNRQKLTCRERIDLLLDGGSFREVGSLAGFASYDADGGIADFTPANHVGGWGAVDGRRTIVCADDFTSRGGHSDGAIGQKSRYLDELSLEFRCPSVRLLDGSSGGGSVASMVPKQEAGEGAAKESTGAIKAGRPRVSGGGGSFLPGHLGSEMYATQLSCVPVVNVLLGSVVGIGAAKAVLGHFSVMVRDIAQLFVAGPPVVAHAMGYDITKEELGDWRIHCRNGAVDNLAGTEAEAVEQTKRFLSYLPPSVWDAPPRTDCDDPVDRREEELFTIVPRKRTTTFDMRRAIRLMADKGSFFEMGALWGSDQITGLARFGGIPVGIMASDSRHENGGALTADGCDKLKRLSDLCDLFHLPIVNLVDNPGFAVGVEHEVAATIRKGGEWMIAFSQVSVPIFTVILRRSFGVAGNNYATPKAAASARVVWPAADVGGIPPEGGIEAAYKRQLAEAEDPAALRAEIEARIESVRGPVGPLNRFQMEEMIDPRDTRRWICEWAENAWRIVTQPGRLGPRPLGWRP
ncbi:carboxyl transferase domain-containing protein [Phenylobacterium sp.]|uniref:carboxyl transferase domain-containing protein n=1 Tax=Phenylobacterium sp. TaxID=1871053 RepID=UPI0025EE6BDD|nr:carboxyl transferase domain-containing protein [Phenylobacterium sp.]MBX3483242.1 ATP-grasp domain-containing protein [Phenylobacterium sp.]